MEFRHLAALRAVAEHGSITAAATKLGYTQSAVSQQIAALELELGVRVLARPGGSRPVQLTDVGRRVAQHAIAVLDRVEMMRQEAERTKVRQRVLRIGTIGSTAVHLLPVALRTLGSEDPGLTVRLQEERSDEPLLKAVEQGRLDVTFAQLPVPTGPFAWKHLLTGKYVVIAAAGQQLPDDPDAILAAVASLPLIAYSHVRAAHNIERYLRLLGFSPQVVFRTDDNSTVQRLVGVGLGCAIVPEIATDPNDPLVRIVHDVPALPPSPIGLAWHADASAPTSFIAAASSAARQYVEMRSAEQAQP